MKTRPFPTHNPADTDPEFTAFLTEFVTGQRLERINDVLELRTRWLTVVLDDLYQTHNASACLRSCESFGVQDVHIVERQNPHVIARDIDAGASRWLTLHRHRGEAASSEQYLRQLRRSGYQIVATGFSEAAVSPTELNLDRPTAILFGNEMHGLREEVLEQADCLLQIPMTGFTRSFNVSVACALVLHSLTERLRTLDVQWQLTDAEKQQLRAEWIRRTIGHRLEPLRRRFDADQTASLDED
ncbi:MAG: RNA methyltransferase [Planctomycetaceae bacterium]|nr:RNA methyltransferase [Planctomycetaceae bacterium]